MSDDDNSNHSCDNCYGEERWVKFCDKNECKNYVNEKIYEKLVISYFDYKLETDTVFNLVNESDKFNPPLFDLLLKKYSNDVSNWNIQERVRTKISNIKESVNSFSGSYMLKYLLDLAQKKSISAYIKEKIEREIRDTYKYNILRDDFIEMCDDAVEYQQNINKEATVKPTVDNDDQNSFHTRNEIIIIFIIFTISSLFRKFR